MRYRSTTGLDHDQIRELVRRIDQLRSHPTSQVGRPPALSSHRSVLPTLVLLRHNLPQALAADLFGVSQPTVSRVFRRYAPLLGQVTCPHTPPMPEPLRGRVVIVDGTLVPTGRLTADYDGKRRRHAFTTVGYDTLLDHSVFLGDLGHQGTAAHDQVTPTTPRRTRSGTAGSTRSAGPSNRPSPT
ncbi:transposase family protein [Saccharothrix syringae]|uniref:helix-turn-helix domain-containing protein n=1 Tax=Saccharothrix syringae TaxID=103733 RepID=UPI0031F78CEA